MLSLERIEISGVRSVGWSSGGAPGLVLEGLGRVSIVSAPNGVGKTSVIEALTLALTGEPRRRGKSLPLEAITHHPRASERARVILGFSSGKELRWEEPDANAEADWRKALRKVAADLLSEGTRDPDVVANLLRLTHLLPQGWGERFTDQEGNKRWTLVERALDLEGFRAAVQEGKNRGSIKVALDKAESDAMKLAEDARKALERWVACVASLSRARQGAREAGARSPAEVKAELDSIAAELEVQPGATPAQRLRQIIGERRAALAKGLATAQGLSSRREELEAQVAGAAAALTAAEEALREAKSRSQAARIGLAHAEAAAARAGLPALRAARDQAATAERACTMLAHIAVLEEGGSAVRDAEARLAEVPDANALDAAVVTAHADLDAAVAELNDARRHLAELERDHHELGRLLREMRAHVASDSCEPRDCPVCGTRFPGKELLERLDDRLGALRNAAIEEGRHLLVLAETRASELSTKARTATERRDAANAAQTLRDSGLKSIAGVRAWYPALVGDGSPDGSDLAEALRAEVKRLVPDGKIADTSLERARLATESAARALIAAEETVAAGDALPPHPSEALSIDVARHRRELAEQTLRVAVEEHAAAARRLSIARGASEAIATEWARAVPRELADTPLDQLPAKLETTRHTHTLALDLAETRLGAAEKSAEAYSRLEAVRLAEDAIRTEARAFGEDLSAELSEGLLKEVETRLRERMDETTQEAERVGKGAKTVRGWIKGLSDELQRYEDECLKELDPVVDRFRDALAPTMHWRMTLRKYRNEALPGFSDTDAPDADPSNILSEGEHTAVALAYLFAFHSRFRWSRWPALVLDDPFQSADVVRAGALLDVLQGMSIERGTQILLTTHDPQLADWAKRKMTRAGVDTRLFELERTADGIRANRT